jgi:uncharacterized membrane protein
VLCCNNYGLLVNQIAIVAGTRHFFLGKMSIMCIIASLHSGGSVFSRSRYIFGKRYNCSYGPQQWMVADLLSFFSLCIAHTGMLLIWLKNCLWVQMWPRGIITTITYHQGICIADYWDIYSVYHVAVKISMLQIVDMFGKSFCSQYLLMSYSQCLRCNETTHRGLK